MEQTTDREKDGAVFPVITLYQPWATWIMRGWKTIETRTHNRFACLIHKTVLIHAGLTTDIAALNNHFLTAEQMTYKSDEMANGFILGSVYVDAAGLLSGHYYENKAALIDTVNRYGLFLKDVKKLKEPIPAKGGMGIWYYDLSKKEKVTKPKILNPSLF